jgi:hypothetical protein
MSLTARTRPRSNVVPLTAARGQPRGTEAFVSEATARCPKCDSAFLSYEPAFIHCRYCGTMARLASGSLLEQELFELRSGLRIAS